MKKKNPKVRLNPDGVPIEARDWTVEDWRDLWIAVQAVEIRIAARYREAQEGGCENCPVEPITATSPGASSVRMRDEP